MKMEKNMRMKVKNFKMSFLFPSSPLFTTRKMRNFGDNRVYGLIGAEVEGEGCER